LGICLIKYTTSAQRQQDTFVHDIGADFLQQRILASRAVKDSQGFRARFSTKYDNKDDIIILYTKFSLLLEILRIYAKIVDDA